MKITAWKYADLLAISELEKQCFPEEPWSYKTLAASFESPAFFGVLSREGEDISGYGGITVAADSADIENIAVDESYRRCGLGTELLNELIKIAKEKGAKKIFLEVRVSNSAAMLMYLKSGFKGVYARTRYYSNGEDCLIMCKEIED